MPSSYFSLPRFARAAKNQAELEKKDPKQPVMNDDDEKFLTHITSHEAAPEQAKDVKPTVIADDGEEKEVPKEKADEVAGTDVVVPETQPSEEPAAESSEKAQEEVDQPKDEATTDSDAPKEEPTESASEPTGVTTEKKEEESPAEKDEALSAETKEEAPVVEKEEAASAEKKEEPPAEKTEETPAEKTEETPAEAEKEEAAPAEKEDTPTESEEATQKEESSAAAKPKKSKKDTGFELPSQEEAEAATRGLTQQTDKKETTDQAPTGEKRTWASYLPSIGKTGKTANNKDGTADKAKEGEGKPEEKEEEKSGEKGEQKSDETSGKKEEEKSGEEGEAATDQASGRTWKEYAAAYVPSSLPAIPSLPASWTRSKDGKHEPVLNEDGSVNEEATKEKEQKEVNVLLDNLQLSSLNNRVFALSEESQKIYGRFSLVLKDVINGAPTAYDDMDKLMHDAGPTLEKQFNSMPPFVQTLVKSLPAKLGTTLGPELLAAASEKPGADLNKRMAAASKEGGESSTQSAETETSGEKSKKKKTIPGLKGLVSQQGTVASILRSIVSFLQTRFPFLVSGTNIVMTLSVFILMLVFWYCYKRGKEVRLAKEAAAVGEDSKDGAADVEEDDEVEVESTDDEVDEAEDEKAAVDESTETDAKDSEGATGEKEEVPSESEPAEAPHSEDKEGKGAELEAEKAVAA